MQQRISALEEERNNSSVQASENLTREGAFMQTGRLIFKKNILSPLGTSFRVLQQSPRNRFELISKLQDIQPAFRNLLDAVSGSKEAAGNRSIRVGVAPDPHHVHENVFERARVEKRSDGEAEAVQNVS